MEHCLCKPGFYSLVIPYSPPSLSNESRGRTVPGQGRSETRVKVDTPLRVEPSYDGRPNVFPLCAGRMVAPPKGA